MSHPAKIKTSIRQQVEVHPRPLLGVAADLHHLRQHNSRGVLNLHLLPVVGYRVRTVALVGEVQRRAYGSTRNGRILIDERIAILRTRTRPQLRAVAARVVLRSGGERQIGPAGAPEVQVAGFETRVRKQLLNPVAEVPLSCKTASLSPPARFPNTNANRFRYLSYRIELRDAGKHQPQQKALP